MKELKMNHAAVWVSIVLQFVIGFLWFGPLFGQAWMDLVGLDMSTIEADPAGAAEWITNIISAVVSVYLLAWIFTRMGTDSWMKGLILGCLVGFAFTILPNMTYNLFGKMPYALAWVNGGFTTFGLMVSGVILGAWKKYKD